MVSEDQQAVFNFDVAELIILFQFKERALNAIQEFNLERAYWELRGLRRELDAKLDRRKKEDETSKEHLKLITAMREQWLVNKNNEDLRNEFFTAIEEFYEYLCYLAKSHGIYFREGLDASKAALRN